uniref:UDP-glucose:glycoprotein glucosyltransferase 1 isoform X2 n=1 Tax=Ciona intestinalis TaxID=7719 RepID=UPI0002B8E4EE|nr:UDP-glucose:glycoprotein glucosyltransferase 1 isoform X2 [Ciona intestinalis]|eukprot:XP_002120850.2 UDP-glucose:glycoprotein glucosyltransferase 1 isoform X2 [Ciona intestinalis]
MCSNLIFFITTLVCLSSIIEISKADPKSIVTSLKSKWKSTPLIIEASEFMASESTDAFWKYVETIMGFDIAHQTDISARTLYQTALKAAHITFDDDKMDSLNMQLLKFALSLRTYSPRVEMFHQLAVINGLTGCDIFFDVHGQKTCEYSEVHQLLKSAKMQDLQPSTVFKQDHVFPESKSSDSTIILYANIASTEFKQAHDLLKRLAKAGEAKYVLRHFIRSRPDKGVQLSGYGVELAMKSTEYKAIDDSVVKDDGSSASLLDDGEVEVEGFNFSTLARVHPQLTKQLAELRGHLMESTNEMQPMKIWQLQDLSFQAATRVLNAPKNDQLKILKDISQNFPTRVRTLVKQQVPDELRHEIKQNQRSFEQFDIDQGQAMFLLNGIQIDVDETDMFKLLDMLRSEGKLISGLKKLNLNSNQIQKAMKLNVHPEASGKHILDIRESAIIWANDIETDERYKRWPANVHELLRPAFPGTLRRVRKNMFHLVFVIDPTHADAKYLVEAAEIFWANDVPLRIGFSFLVDDSAEIDGNDDAGVALVRAYNYARDEMDDNEKSFSFLTNVYKSLKEGSIITVEHIIQRLKQKFKSADIDDILGSSSEFDSNRKLGKSFQSRTALVGPVNVLMNGALLSDDDISDDMFEQVVLDKIMEETPVLQRAAYMGELSNNGDPLEYLMSRNGVVPRFNDRVLSAEANFFDLLGNAKKESVYLNPKQFAKLSNSDKTATISEQLSTLYLSKTDSSKHIRPITMWVIADVETSAGRSFVYSALKHVKTSSNTRLAIIHNPKNTDHLTSSSKYMRAVEAAILTQQNNHARNFILKLLKPENAAKIASSDSLSEFYVGGMAESAFEKAMTSDPKVSLAHITAHSDWSTTVLNLEPGQNAVLANGKLIGPLDQNEVFVADDFLLIEILMYSSSGEKIQEVVKSMQLQLTPPEKSDIIMKLTSHLSSQPKVEAERRDLSPPFAEHSVVDLPSSDPERSSYDILAVLDPASNIAQQIIPVIEVLREVLDANVKIYMNCKEKLSDLPVKRFYRFVLEPELSFKVDNKLSDGPLAKFSDMPNKSLLTLTMHPPEGWMVEAVSAVHDLDNIKLSEIRNKLVSADYELEYLVLEGHARDVTTGQPPRGLQFTLGATKDKVTVDTIVMANLGYFQLKASPGVWYLNLRHGKSSDIYDIVSHENTDSSTGDVIVLMDSFKSKVIVVKVSKKSDKSDSSLLEDDESEGKKEEGGGGGIWNSIKSSLGGGGGESESKEWEEGASNSSDVINVFSLASGHLYERLMRIMMLSVMRHTTSNVKFWVLKNYLSPQFKDFIPHMAEEYGFEYELVQYKWPRWLRQQTEKQRTMWGYKILFLDVLFPLNVEKIIFVDADQIVRANLKELRDLDLEGNPYGYTPFCSDRTEMDGFRFWKGGYWAQHLAGRKYHISAIYVVDLKKFRQIAAGDRLRGQYQGLSQDPNSLANLDQDLPNNMIHQVGIKSLPQEWLWCSTWCSDDSLSRAKTIDLCNNPLTKEPKLEAAVRLVKEWPDYDEEIKTLQSKFSPEGNQSSKSKDKETGFASTLDKSAGKHEEL